MIGALLAAACTVVALALLVGPGPRLTGAGAGSAGRVLRGPAAGATGRGGRRRRLGTLVVLALVGGACWALAGSVRLVLLAVICSAAAVGAARLWSAGRVERRARATRARVVELCDALQAELAAGQTPVAALERAGAEWPLVGPVARTAVAGGDVPTALRSLATEPGAGELRVVAGAWQVAHRTGHGLADALGRVADELRAGEQTRRVVAGELSSARATARLLAGLPLAALLMGSGAGGDPWGFLLGHPVGLACLAGGLACGYAGLAWIEALARDVERGRT